MNLSECQALVTGGAVRIGRAIAEMLADAGCGLAIHYRRSADEATALAERLGGKTRVTLVRGDLSSAAECRRIIDESWRSTGGFNILINNASVFHKDDLASATAEKLDAELRVNFLAPVHLTRAFAEKLCPELFGAATDAESGQAAPRGKAIHLLDRRIAGVDVSCVPYELSKKMLAEYTRQSALELGPYIAVNGVAPGAILPPRSVGEGTGDPVRDWAGPTPLRGPCGPDAVAAAVRFLLEADGMTGQTIFVDNGRHLIR